MKNEPMLDFKTQLVRCCQHYHLKYDYDAKGMKNSCNRLMWICKLKITNERLPNEQPLCYETEKFKEKKLESIQAISQKALDDLFNIRKLGNLIYRLYLQVKSANQIINIEKNTDEAYVQIDIGSAIGLGSYNGKNDLEAIQEAALEILTKYPDQSFFSSTIDLNDSIRKDSADLLERITIKLNKKPVYKCLCEVKDSNAPRFYLSMYKMNDFVTYGLGDSEKVAKDNAAFHMIPVFETNLNQERNKVDHKMREISKNLEKTKKSMKQIDSLLDELYIKGVKRKLDDQMDTTSPKRKITQIDSSLESI